MELSIIIPTKDRGDVFDSTIRSAHEAIKDTDSEIIVINDSKTKDVKLPFSSSQIRIFNNPKSGVASARNFGVSKAKHSVLLFLDDDVFISRQNLKSAYDFISASSNSTLNPNWIYPQTLTSEISKTKFGRYLIRYGFTSLKGWSQGMAWNDQKIFRCELLASYFLMIRLSDFKSVNGYNEHFPHAGAEDYDFAIRIRNAGIQTFIDPTNMVYHNESDRVDLLPWLQRKERAAQTRKLAVTLGHEQLAINAGGIKKTATLALYPFRRILLTAYHLIPNMALFDRLSFFIINRLVSVYLYKGYFSDK